MIKIKGTEEQELLQMIIRMIQSPPYLCKWSLAKRTVLQMTKIKGTEEHGLLQMTIWIIQPPPCSSVPLQMGICKKDGSLDVQNQGDGGAGIVANYHLDDPAFANGHCPVVQLLREPASNFKSAQNLSIGISLIFSKSGKK